MKRMLFLLVLIFNVLNANIISIDNSNLNGGKIIYFTNNAEIKVSPYKTLLYINNEPMELVQETPFVISLDEQLLKVLGIKNSSNDESKLSIYKINSIVSKLFYNNFDNIKDSKFLIRDGNILYLASIKKEKVDIYSIFKNKDVKASKIYIKLYKILKYTPKGYVAINNNYDNLFELYVDENSNILKFSFKNMDFELQKVYNKFIDTYKEKENSLVTKITKPYDLSSKLTSIFVLNEDLNQYRLIFTRFLYPKNKNIIFSKIETSNKIFKPKAPLDLKYLFTSLSFNVPHKFLFELKGIFKEDDNVIYNFLNNPKSRNAQIIYKNSQNEIDKVKYENSTKGYYTFSNLINLLEWMRYNKKSSQSIMLFFDNIKPVNYDIFISDTSFEIKKGSKVSFKGTFNKYGYVNEISINNKKLKLEDLYSDITYKNRKILKEFKIAHHIIEIKEK
jgi:hypothetical protein